MNTFTLSDFLKRYSTSDKCLEEIKRTRFPKGIYCKICKARTKHYKIKGRLQYACANCGTHVAPLVGTIFEKTSTPLTSWFYAMFLMINTRAGISSKQLQRELGVTYKTAWRINKQIRTLMAETDMTFDSGIVEIDETYVGGKPRLHEWGNGVADKEAIMGMVQRDGKVFLKHVPSTGKWEVLDQVKAHIDPKVRVITDEYGSYTQLKKLGYKHDVVNHKVSFLTKKDVHTQNIENVWSHLKRGIYGVYRHVSKKYLQAYADEFAFRYNNRHDAGQMFFKLLQEVVQTKMISLKQLSLASR